MREGAASGPTTEVVVVLPLDTARGTARGTDDAGEAVDVRRAFFVHCFLPVRDVGLRFGVHAEFALTSSRDDVHDSPWNRWLRDLVPGLFVAAVAAQPAEACRR